MLDDEEFTRVTSRYAAGTEGNLVVRQFELVLQEYEPITGFHETNPNAIYHRQLSFMDLIVGIVGSH